MKKKVISCILIISVLSFLMLGCVNETGTSETENSTGDIVTETLSSEEVIPENNGLNSEDETVDISSNSDLSVAKVGDIVKFGRYEQDNNLENGPEAIEWIVLDEQDGKILLISKYALEYLPMHVVDNYHAMTEDVTWENCFLRVWLNDTFYNSAFVITEQEKICLSELISTVCYTEGVESYDSCASSGAYLVGNNMTFDFDEYEEPYVKQFEQFLTSQDNVFVLDYNDLIKYNNLKIIEEEVSYEYYDGTTGTYFLYNYGEENFEITPTVWAEKWGMAVSEYDAYNELYGFSGEFVWYRSGIITEWENEEYINGNYTGALVQLEDGTLYGCTRLGTQGYVYPAIWVDK